MKYDRKIQIIKRVFLNKNPEGKDKKGSINELITIPKIML